MNIHLQHHKGIKQIIVAQQDEVDHQNERELFLLDAIEDNNIEAVRGNIYEVPEFGEKLLRKALQSSSRQMIKLLLDVSSNESELHQIQGRRWNVLPWAVEAANFEAAQILLERGFSADEMKDEYTCMYHAMMNTSPEMIKLLLQFQPKEPDTKTPGRKVKSLCCMIPTANHLELVVNEQELVARVIKCLDLLHDWTEKNYHFDECFKKNAERGCSIAIAKYLLENGVSVNTRGMINSGSTALYKASARRGKREAEFMRFLLESGADPSLKTQQGIALADKPGPRNIEKWLGVSWDQLVQDSAKVYAASLPAASEKEYRNQDDNNVKRDGDIIQLDDEDNASALSS